MKFKVGDLVKDKAGYHASGYQEDRHGSRPRRAAPRTNIGIVISTDDYNNQIFPGDSYVTVLWTGDTVAQAAFRLYLELATEQNK
jgi:hypothetical protein